MILNQSDLSGTFRHRGRMIGGLNSAIIITLLMLLSLKPAFRVVRNG